MKKRKRKIYPLILVVVGLVLVFTSIGICSLNIRRNLQYEMQNTLMDIAAQNALAVNNEITVQFRLLTGFSEELGKDPDRVMDILDEMSKFVQAYEFKRMGYCDASGMTMTTDGYTANLSDRVFFIKSMEGENWVTRTLEDRIGDEKEPINVLSVPLYNAEQTEVIGVIFATYRSEIFQERLNVDFFEGQGFSCIIKADGDVISHSENSPIADSENFLEYLRSSGENGNAAAEDMKAAMDAGESGVGECEAVQGNGESAIFYYTPLNEDVNGAQWYMVAIAPRDVLTKRMEPVVHQVQILAVAMLVISVVGVGAFVVMERRRQEELSSLAYEDPLTGGYNFASFRENVKIRKGLPGYVVAMDVSDFKLVNSFFGVQKGDETLLELWQILLNSVSEAEMVARVNADRFVLFLQAEHREQLEKRLQELVSQIHDISPRLNIPALFPIFGIYYTEALDEPDKCYGYAVQAKHLVKGRRDRHYAFYDEIDYEQILADRRLEDSFEEALKQRQFETWYQPKYSAQEEKIIGAEALVRWRKPDGTLLSPGVFIPLFEKNGCIAVLDEYIFHRVCEQQKAWLDEGRSVVPVSVNISRVSLYFGDIVERYQEILRSYNLDPQYVQLEITESATVDNAEISNLIERFHNAGFEMLLDDFGSGYSSLASLNTLRFDTLKLDKSLIDYIGDENGEKLLEHITKLGQSLGLHITAEGVETHSQLIFLRDLRCDDIQGYYFSKPLPMKEYQELT